MKHSFLLSKVSGAALAAVASLAFLTTAAHAQQNLYFDPTGLQTGNGSGGSGEFDTDGTADFYLPGSGDQIFPDYATTPSVANFDGVGGTVTVNDPANDNGGSDPQPVATDFDGMGSYTVNGPGTIDYQVQNGNTFISNSGGNVDIEANSTVTETPTGVNQLNITNSGSANLTVGGTMALSGSDLTAQDTDHNTNPATDPNAGLVSNEPSIALLVNNTGGGTLDFNATVTNPNLGNTTTTFYNGSSYQTQSVGEFFGLTFTAGTNEFNGNILGTNTGYDQNSGSSTTDNLVATNAGTTLLVDNSNFDRFEVTNGASLLTNGAVTVAATDSFTSQNGTIGGNTADTSTFSGTIANFGGTEYLTAVAGGRVNFTGDLDGGTRTIEGAGIIDIAADTHYAEQYGSGSETLVGTDILSGATLLITNTVGSATGNGTQQAGSGGSNNLVMIESGGTLGGTGITQQNVVTADGTSAISPGEMTNAKVSSIGTLHLGNGLNAANGLTVNFDINGTNNDQIQLASATTGEYGPVSDGAVATELVLGGTDTFNFTNLGTVVAGNDYALFTFDTGSVDISDADFVLKGPAGYTASTPFLVTDGSTESLDVTFTAEAIPEPSTWALMGLGALILIGSGKFRKLRA